MEKYWQEVGFPEMMDHVKENVLRSVHCKDTRSVLFYERGDNQREEVVAKSVIRGTDTRYFKRVGV